MLEMGGEIRDGDGDGDENEERTTMIICEAKINCERRPSGELAAA